MARKQIEGGGNDEDAPHHAFWSTQPMPHGDGRSELPEGPIHNPTVDEIRAMPYNMPAGFEWGVVDVEHNEDQLSDLYKLLSSNYVEDDDALFRFDYSPQFLLWALTPPNYRVDFLVGVYSSASKKLVAFISGVPATVCVYDKTVPVVEINFLCVHKKLRSKRLAPVLIKEMTRRANLQGIYQAVYTAGTVLPVPVSSARYYHRSLNPKKLVNVGFSRLPPNGRTTLARLCKIYALPAEPVGVLQDKLRPMTAQDVPHVKELLNRYLAQFKVKAVYTDEEVAHWFLPRDKVMDSFVAASSDGVVTDFLSFYHLPSSILSHDKELLYAAYSYYNVATTVPLEELMRNALILAKSKGADVFNALNLMDNSTHLLEELKFGIGDGQLQYYLYNWSCPEMKSPQVGLVLL